MLLNKLIKYNKMLKIYLKKEISSNIKFNNNIINFVNKINLKLNIN